VSKSLGQSSVQSLSFNMSIFLYYLKIVALVAVNIVSAAPVQDGRPTVELDFGTFVGAQSSTYNLTYFRKIPFGASTAGSNRFRAPQPPLPVISPYDTDQSFDMCVQRTVNGSEDCLYLGLYSRPWTSSQPLRPVLLTFYGGGFIQGSASFTIPPSGFPVLNVSQSNDYVVVYSNYRTNVFGLLPGKKIKESSAVDLNPGLLDQQAALQWIQKYIHHFGGDKTNVTIWGQSAGGGSVVAQTIATGNRGKGLFRKAMASSPYWPKTYRYDDPKAEELYDQVVDAVGCKGQQDDVKCLQNADVQALRDISLKLSSSHTYNTSSYTWSPVIDDAFLTESLSKVIRSGKLNADFVLSSYNLHEGETFVQSSVNFDTWLSGFLPDFKERDYEKSRSLYPESGEAEGLVYNSTYTRVGLVYRDLVLACPAYWLSKTADKGWLVEYTINPAKHASDTIYVSHFEQAHLITDADDLNLVEPGQCCSKDRSTHL
jgi:carboxylesterase type B